METLESKVSHYLSELSVSPVISTSHIALARLRRMHSEKEIEEEIERQVNLKSALEYPLNKTTAGAANYLIQKGKATLADAEKWVVAWNGDRACSRLAAASIGKVETPLIDGNLMTVPGIVLS